MHKVIRLAGRVKFTFTAPFLQAQSGETWGAVQAKRAEQLCKMGAAVTSAAFESHDIGVAPCVSGAGWSWADGGYITMVVPDDGEWSTERLDKALYVLGARVYALMGADVDAEKRRRDEDNITAPMFTLTWVERYERRENGPSAGAVDVSQ